MPLLVRDYNFYKTLLMLTVPLIMQSVLSTSVSFVDNIMVGQLGETAIAGVMAANQVHSILAALCFGIATALVVIAAQYWGKKDMESVKAVASIGLMFAVLLGLVLSAAVIFAPGAVLRIFTDDAGVIYEGVRYIRIIAFSYLFFCISQVLVGTMRCVEVVRIGVVVSLATLIISVSLNYALIFGNWGFPALGIEGAAIATLAARTVEVFIMLVYVRFIDKRLKIRFWELLSVNRQLLGDFLRYGLPVVGGILSWGIVGVLKIAILGRLGEAVMAASSIAGMLYTLVGLVTGGIAGASGVIIGKTVGSGDYDLVKQYSRTLQVIFVVIGLIGTLGMLALRDVFISLYNFTGDTQIIARQFMTVLAVTVVFTAYHASCFQGIIRAGGDTKFGLIVNSVCGYLQVLPLTFLAAFVFEWSPWVVMLCIYSDQFYKWIIALIKTNRFKWIKNLTRDSVQSA